MPASSVDRVAGFNPRSEVVHRLLVRVADPVDRRRAVLRLTSRGSRVNAATHGTVEAAVSQALQQVSERERKAARRVVELIAERLEGEPTG